MCICICRYDDDGVATEHGEHQTHVQLHMHMHMCTCAYEASRTILHDLVNGLAPKVLFAVWDGECVGLVYK